MGSTGPICSGMSASDLGTEGWHKPWSGTNGGSCVEARRHEGLIEVRNSKARDAGTVRFTTEEWDSFLFGAKGGEFDQLLVD